MCMEIPTHRRNRAAGRRSLLVALLITCVVATYLLSTPSRWKLVPSNTLTTPTPQPESVAKELAHAHVEPESSRPETTRTHPTHQPLPSALSQAIPPLCRVKKVSMLYGAHRFKQLEDALDLHHQHSDRWGCAFETLDRDLTNRKLYSKHYFLLSLMLQELAKPEEHRQKWLM